MVRSAVVRVYCRSCGQALWFDYRIVALHYLPIFLDLSWKQVDRCPRCGRLLGVATVADVAPAEPMAGG